MSWLSDTWAEITSGGDAVTETYNGGGSVNTSSKDADMGVGAINSGGTYSGSDNAVSGGFNWDNSNDNDGSSSNSGTGNIGGAAVTYTGTPGEGNFFVKDESFIDPYEYLELIGGDYDSEGNWTFDNADGSTVYSDNAAFDLSHYVKDEDHAADVAFYNKNPNSTITTEQYTTAKRISSALGLLAGPLGLGSRAIIELQRRGIVPGNTATSWFDDKNVPENSNTSNDDRIMALVESGATNAQIKDELAKISASDEIAGVNAAIGAMSDAAFNASQTKAILDDPVSFFSDFKLEDGVPNIGDVNAPDTTKLALNESAVDLNPQQVQTDGLVQTGNVTTPTAQGYDVVTAENQIQEGTAAQGTVSDAALVNAEQIDVEETAAGLNALGQALDNFASVDISRVIDTSTVSGKLLADKLGEGGYVDSKATILGQLDIISSEFKDANGNPTIPPWAQSVARSANKNIALGNLSGSAQTAVMANAIMEATLGVAEKEANFFQTLTIDNLENRQEALIQKASVLSNLELANLDNRQEAVVANAKAFLEMDLTNLNNEQQTALLNTELRADAMLTDVNAQNAQRLFTAQTQADFNKFYDQLNTNISMHRDEILANVAKFNAGEVNDNAEFRADMELRRDAFQKEMLFNIEKAVYEWEQTIALEESRMSFEAAKFDMQNLFDLTTDTLARTWDREDAYFDYLWKSSETELERKVDLYEIDKEYEAEMFKANNDVAYKQGQADWELFKWGSDFLFGDDFDIWDII